MTLKEGKRKALREHFLASGSSFLVALERDLGFFEVKPTEQRGLAEALTPARKVSWLVPSLCGAGCTSQLTAPSALEPP